MEVGTLIEAHKFTDLETDIKALVAEINADESDAAIHGLLQVISEATVRFAALRDDYVQWRSGTNISPQVKVRFSRHVEMFHRLITKAMRTLTRLGHAVECPPYPHSPLPPHADSIEAEVSTNPDELTAASTANGVATKPRVVIEGAGESQTFPTELTNKFSSMVMQQHLQPPPHSSNFNHQPSAPSPPKRFVFPDIQMTEDATRRCSVALPLLPTTNSEADKRAKEAELE